MASSRESSPVDASCSTSPAQLTPRSKVKALLAVLDNDSDGESNSESPRARLASSFTKQTSLSPEGVSTNSAEQPVEDVLAKEPESISDEEDEEIVRPRGRMAARMRASEEEESVVENARDRVRKMLLAKSKSPGTPTQGQEDERSDKNDTLIQRKRKMRVSRQGTPASIPRTSSASPSIFVSPSKLNVASPPGDASDSDELPSQPATNDRFLNLVAKKREERLAMEAERAEQKAKEATERKRHNALLEDDEGLDGSDDNIERRLTQQARPTRKASKKAVDEIHRETQRLSRNQQLAHKAITRKKITKASLFAKFNYKPAGLVEGAGFEPARPASSSSAQQSDIEINDTPPTSPASHASGLDKTGADAGSATAMDEAEEQHDEDGPSLEDPLSRLPSSPPSRLDKGKGKAIEEASPEPEISKMYMFTQRPVRIRQPKLTNQKASAAEGSDSDLEIVTAKAPVPKKRLDSIFDRVPAKQAKESHSLHALRMLAHLTSPGKQIVGKAKNPSMTTTELQVSLQQRARQQATREREQRLQALRDRGVIVQTAEEREKEMAEVEDLIAKARREGEEIKKREKAAAKKETKANGEMESLGDSSDDEDWEEEEEDLADVSGSGSEDDGESEEDGSDAGGEEKEEGEAEDAMSLDIREETETAALNPMFDDEAAESDEDEEEAIGDLSADEEVADHDEEENDENLPANQKRHRTRKTIVVSDDEDEVDDPKSPSPRRTDSPLKLYTDSPIAPNSVLRSATKTFIPGLTVAGPAGLGLTQIFAGTMDETQIEALEASPTVENSGTRQIDSEQDSLAFLRRLSGPELPAFMPTMEEDTQDVVMDSQSRFSHISESQPMDSTTQGIQLNYSQSQIHGFDSLVQDPMATQFSEFPELTQDAGFQHMTPIKGRFVEGPPSTIDTVLLGSVSAPEPMEETPTLKKKGKLRQRAQIAAFSDEDDAQETVEGAIEADESEISTNAFDVMRKASKKKNVVIDEFDKKNSKAKEMVNEQAEESEDEYAGLGGASDDESGGEEDAYVKEMIDDEGGKDVDESKLAAFFADRERANDEKQVEKLYKDITKGMLRRKRGADYDLSDSDDGGEARQRRKRKEFAKMRKALLADERIGKIAENPKRQAFLRAIEDRGSEDEMDFLEDFAEQDEETDSQAQSQGEGSQQRVPDSQPSMVMPPPKRKHSDDTADIDNRPPPALRRTRPAKKPSNLSEVRESLSSLIEEPNAMIMPADSGSDSENELEIEGEIEAGLQKERVKENRDPFARRRTNVPIVDRISLKRASSSSISNNTRLAFAASSATQGFKVPPLLRRATTNNSLASTTSSTSSSVSSGMSATERMAGGASRDGVKRGGGKNSGVHYFARESERKAAVVKTEKRREQKRFKGAEVRRKVVGGLFGGGKFE